VLAREKAVRSRDSPLTAPRDLTTASCNDDIGTDATKDVPIVVSTAIAVQIGPAIEFREVGGGGDCDRRNLTTTTPLALPSSWVAVLVVVFEFGAVRPSHHPPLRRSTPLLENGGRARSRRWGQRRRRSQRESSSSCFLSSAPSLLYPGRCGAVVDRELVSWGLVAQSQESLRFVLFPLLRLTNSLFATAPPLLLHNNDGAHDGNPADDDCRPNRRQRQPQSRDRALPPFVNDGLKRRFQRHYRGRVAPETKTKTSIASHDDGSPNGVVVVELWRSQLTPAPTSRNSTWGVVWTVTTAEPTMGMSGMTSPSFLLSQETVLRSFGALLPQVSSCSLHFFSL
jgi:hypothetical protein